MLFVAVHTHPAAQCPLKTEQGKAMVKQLFSEENVRKAGMKIEGAYVSCPKDESVEHKGFFIVDGESAKAVSDFFGPMKVELREVVPFSEIAKTL
ncbi:MAG: hypothetical protein NWE93_03090 [Candidatus Bathyarchaeota archaeon]|nr:hypothetical protein [Candidatus Bathyarchaeota archaeon]